MFDWISPLLGLGEWLSGKQGISVTSSQFTPRQIIRLLRSGGIDVGAGSQVIGDETHLMVDDRAKAERILRRHNILYR